MALVIRVTFQQTSCLIVTKLRGRHMGGELKDNSDEDIKMSVDVVVIGNDDASAVIPTEREFRAVNEDAQNIQLERSCSQDEPRIIGSLRHDCSDSFRFEIGTFFE